MTREEIETQISEFLYYQDECNHPYYRKLFEAIYDLGHNDAKHLDYKPPKTDPLTETGGESLDEE